MRDPARIDVVLAAIREAWERNPDARLTQLVFNATSKGLADTEAPLSGIEPRFYNAEDDVILRGLAR